jgi:glycosyltransferase involved in cell wall biosynthesis
MIIKNLPNQHIDVLFSINGLSFAYFNDKKYKKVVWVDNTVFTYFENYDIPQMSEKMQNSINALEKKSFENCTIICVASNWLKNEIINKYQLPESKIKVVPRGANLSSGFCKEDLISAIDKREKTVVNLVFVGRDWFSKGGDIALKVAEQLNIRGVKTHLTIFGQVKGCPYQFDEFDFITYHEKYNLEDTKSIELVRNTLAFSNFLIVPSRADGFGIVFAEAATFGLPSIALDIMGVENSVINDITGKRFNEINAIEDISNYITDLFEHQEKYHQLCLSSYQYAEEHFNWNKNVKKVIELCKNL